MLSTEEEDQYMRVLPTEEEDQYTREYEGIGGDKSNTLRKSENKSE